eukprot:5283896-Prymnesium_polylepis.1
MRCGCVPFRLDRACVHRAWYRARLEAAMLIRGRSACAVRACEHPPWLVRDACVLGCGLLRGFRVHPS